MADQPLLAKPSLLLRAAPFVFVLLWSSSFIAAKIGLRHLSPLAFVAIRLSGCAAVLLVVMMVRGESWAPLRGRRWLDCAIAGTLINGVGLMAPHVGLMLVAPAPIALVQSLTPLLTALLGIPVLGERLRALQWAGMGLGVLGVALVVGLAAAHSTARLDGLALAGVGVTGLVAGTLWFGRFCRGIPLLPGGDGAVPRRRRGFGAGGGNPGNPAARLDHRRGRGGGVEHARRLARRHGALFRPAAAGHGGTGDREFLPGAGHHRDRDLAVPGRASVPARHRRLRGRGDRLLAGQPRAASRALSRTGSVSGKPQTPPRQT